MPNVDDPDEFEARWKAHVDDLPRLHHTLPEEEVERLVDAIDELNELVEIAADEMRDADDEQ